MQHSKNKICQKNKFYSKKVTDVTKSLFDSFHKKKAFLKYTFKKVTRNLMEILWDCQKISSKWQLSKFDSFPIINTIFQSHFLPRVVVTQISPVAFTFTFSFSYQFISITKNDSKLVSFTDYLRNLFHL